MKNRNLFIYIYLFFSICNLFLFQKLEAKGKDNINATSYDSLIIKLNKLKDNDTNKIVILNNLFKLTDSIQFIQKAIKLSETIGYKRGLANSYFELGKYYCFKTNDNKSALSNLIISNHLADEVNNISVLIYTYLYI